MKKIDLRVYVNLLHKKLVFWLGNLLESKYLFTNYDFFFFVKRFNGSEHLHMSSSSDIVPLYSRY